MSTLLSSSVHFAYEHVSIFGYQLQFFSSPVSSIMPRKIVEDLSTFSILYDEGTFRVAANNAASDKISALEIYVCPCVCRKEKNGRQERN